MKVLPAFVPKCDFYVLVSGGIDSIACAHWLKHRYRKDFTVVHFNHRVQRANELMEQSVREFCSDNELELVVHTNPDTGNFSENTLRQWRLSCNAKMTGHFVTGHHLGDVVENYISNCLSGKPHYKPMNEVTNFETFAAYHPFITCPKHDIIEYANENNLKRYVVEDPTNTDLKFKRNWIRHKLAAEIYERNIGIEKVVLKFYNL